MNLLLDTNALLRWLAGDPMESDATNRISDPDVLVAVSAVSIWEIAIKRVLGKLRFDGSIPDEARRDGFEPLAISYEHAERAGGLPPHHRDPFDRLLIAQAQVEGLMIVTSDGRFSAYDVSLLPC